jgi:hypothetical protein
VLKRISGTLIRRSDRRMKIAGKQNTSSFSLFTKYYYENQIKDNENGGSCSKHEADEERTQNFCRVKLRGKLLGKLGHRSEDKSRENLKETGCEPEVFASRPVTDSCEHGTEHSDALIGAKAD